MGKDWRYLKMRWISFTAIFSILALTLPASAGTSLLVKGACYDYTQYDIETARCLAVTDALGHFALYSGENSRLYGEDGSLILTYIYLQRGYRIIRKDTIRQDNSLGGSEVKVFLDGKLLASSGIKPPACPGLKAMERAAEALGFRIRDFRISGTILITELLKED